ncbi:hypothetical protein H257_03634 [Aphanomyces astaci]|uniref:Uncharacterized protein n=1 Tax=Aphanomyces astaci TaxID=112090 RepID=W4GZS2_APHAT|nr:hypothetical protein H257_03634 [Aphanomyces astaci]ETV84418.1 hypothetical protein H257_03634 [Aphanomyces astaci]RQM25025.1 hypothetical protein B5M09_007982 [Aphanomyces astaci]|eukprot:XP_009826110.1 hypothetical protein H257_03634 [Aphanomyces astaci]
MNTWSEPAIFNATSTNVRGLNLINTGGIIREDPVNASPSIVYRASNPDLVRALVVNQNDGANGDTLELELLSQKDIAGDYLLEIYIPSNSLQYIHTGDGGNTVVGPNTLVVDSNRDIEIKALGSGSIFVETENIGSSFFMVEAQSSGDIHINVDNILSADVLDLAAQGRGEVSLLAGYTSTTSLVAVASGSGNVFVGNPTNDRASPSIMTTDLITKVFGDGSVVFLTDGSCASSFVQTSGTGSAFLSSMTCQDTGVVLLNTGNIYVTSTDSFASEDRGTGDVFAAIDALTTNATGTYYPLPDNVLLGAPTYTSLVVPDRTPTTIEIKGVHSTSPDKLPPTVVSRGSNAIGGGCIAGIVLALVLLAAIAGVLIRRRVKARKHPQVKLNYVTEVEFAQLATPAAAAEKVLSMQTA